LRGFFTAVKYCMKRFSVMTLVDITETRQYRKEPDRELERQQQQNFVMLLQTIGMRVNPIYDQAPILRKLEATSYPFGSKYSGIHNVWTFTFNIEYDGGFTDEFGNEYGLLEKDLHLIPIVPELTETAELIPAVFDTKSLVNCNTVVFIS